MREKNKHPKVYTKIKKDVRVLTRFIEIFCRNNHADSYRSIVQVKGKGAEYLKNLPIELCSDCRRLLLHGIGKRIICPYDPKPRCKKCPTYCYMNVYKDKIKEVMRFSGAHLIKRGRLDLVLKYLF